MCRPGALAEFVGEFVAGPAKLISPNVGPDAVVNPVAHAASRRSLMRAASSGVLYDQQQFHALMVRNGVLRVDDSTQSALVAAIRSHL